MSARLRVGAALAALAGLAAACSTANSPPSSGLKTPATTVRHAVGSRSVTLVDTSRPTRASKGQPTKPSRTLPTIIYYPAKGDAGVGDAPIDSAPVASRGPFPLVVLAHGASGLPTNYPALVRAWAGSGYIVAAPTFPLTNRNAAGETNLSDYDQQPADLSFVIDRLLADTLTWHIDPNRIAAAGHSLGAITVLGLTNSCCHDPRIKAVIALAGIALPFATNNHFFAGAPVPVLFVHGTSDRTLPYTSGHQAYVDAPSPKWLLSLQGAGHSEPYEGDPALVAATKVVAAATTDFLDLTLRGDRSAADRIRQDGNVPSTANLDAAP